MIRLSMAVIAVAAVALGAPAAQAQRPSYDRHFLDTAEYFIAPEGMSGAYLYVAIGRMTQPPSAATRNEAQFLVVGGGAGYTVGQRVYTRHYWRTRPASPREVAHGTLVFCLNQERDGVYQAPESREDALNNGWWLATVTDLSEAHRQEVRAGEYRLSMACLRVDAAAPTAAAPGAPAALDAHFLDQAEYFITREPPQGSYQYVAVGRMLQAPTDATRGEAQFLVVGGGAGLTVGQRVWTRHYWSTRPAAPPEATAGRVVFCLNAERDGVYRAPEDRGEALNGGWWRTTITDTSELYREEVRAGEYRLSLRCLRVAR